MTPIEVPTAVDERFRWRSPFWRPGMSVLVEPWTVLAECSTGHLAVPADRNADYGRAVLARWRLLAQDCRPVSGQHVAVSAVLVDPRGGIDDGWRLDGCEYPLVGGASRWSSLVLVTQARACPHCGEPRWPGTYVGLTVPGCAECLPEREVDDPRPCWPRESPRPRDVPAARKRTSSRSKVDAVGDEAVTSMADLAQLDTPDPDRLF